MSPAWDTPLSEPACPGHGLPANVVIPRMSSKLGSRPRCGQCGHRVTQPDGRLPSSRSLPPWTWPVELYDRRLARRLHAQAMLGQQITWLRHVADPVHHTLPIDLDTTPSAPGPAWDWPPEDGWPPETN